MTKLDREAQEALAAWRFAVSCYDPLDPDWRRKARAAGHHLAD